MANYTSAPKKQLKLGDTIVITHKGVEYTLRVSQDHLRALGDMNRAAPLAVWGTADRMRQKLGTAYGYSDTVQWGDWPCFRHGDMAAATRAVRALFRDANGKLSKRERAKLERERAKLEREERKAKQEADAAEAARKEAEVKAEAEKAARRAMFPRPAVDFLSYMDAHTDAFGCQRRHVVAVISAILGVDLTKA